MEFVSWSSFWSFNTELQFNGAEAALVFPCLNVLLLVLHSASVCSMSTSNQTCRIVAMQLPPPPWGIAKMRNLFPPASPVGGRACRVPCRKHCCSHSSHCFSILLRRLPGMEGADRLLETHLPNTQSLCCVSVPLSWGRGLVCQTACLGNCGATPELPHVQLLFYIRLPSNHCCLTIHKKRTCLQFHLMYQTSTILGWLNIKFSICDKYLFQLIFLTSKRKPLLAQLKSSNLIFTILMVMMFGA